MRPNLGIGLYHDIGFTQELVEVGHIAENVKVATELPGGFAWATFDVPMEFGEAFEWQAAMNYAYMRMDDHGGFSSTGFRLFEGRIEDMDVVIEDEGIVLRIKVWGWWRNCFDREYNQWMSAAQYETGSDWDWTPDGANMDEQNTASRLGIRSDPQAVNDWARTVMTADWPYTGYIKQFEFTMTYEGGGVNNRVRIYAVKSTTTYNAGTGLPNGVAGVDYELLADWQPPTNGAKSLDVDGDDFTRVAIHKFITNSDPDETYTRLTNVDFRTEQGRDPEDLIKDIITKSCAQIRQDWRNIEDMGWELPFPQKYEDDEEPWGIIRDINDWGDNSTPKKAAHFAVWDDRIPAFWAQRTAIKWNLPLRNYRGKIASTLKNLRLDVRGKYTDNAGDTQRTAFSSASIAIKNIYRNVTRRYTLTVPVQSEWSDADRLTEAERLRDTFLETYKQRARLQDFRVVDYVIGAAGEKVPVNRIRAGDVIRLPFIPGTLAMAADGLNALHIIRTVYDVETDSMTITPSAPSTSIDVELARVALQPSG